MNNRHVAMKKKDEAKKVPEMGLFQLIFEYFFGFIFLGSWHNLLSIMSNLVSNIKERKIS